MSLQHPSTSTTRVTEFTFNEDPLVTTKVEFELPSPDDLRALHYVPLKRALSINPFLAPILEQFPIEGNHRNVLVDLRAKDLKKGEWPSLDKWHTDLVTHPLDPSKPEVHHIYISGCKAPTLFLKGPVSLPIPEYGLDALPVLNRLIRESNLPYVEAEEGMVTTFNRFHLHKGQQAKVDGIRYLIRVTETDLNRNMKIG